MAAAAAAATHQLNPVLYCVNNQLLLRGGQHVGMQLQAANHIDCTRQGGKAAGLGEQDSAERKQATGSGVLTGFRKGSRQQAAGAANWRVRASRGPSLPTWPPLLEVHLRVLELALADHPAAEASKACMAAAFSSPYLGGKMRRQAGGRQGGQAGKQRGVAAIRWQQQLTAPSWIRALLGAGFAWRRGIWAELERWHAQASSRAEYSKAQCRVALRQAAAGP